MALNCTTGESFDLKTDHMTDCDLKQALFDNVVKMPDWENVVKIYMEDHRAHKMKITSSGHSALHLAISSSKKEIVQTLVKLIIEKDDNNDNNVNVSEPAKEALRMKNEKGHTPLHMAAATGSRKMCRFIVEGAADVGKSLVLERDKKGETPLFRAVHYGRKKAFLYLQSVVCGGANDSDNDISYCWRNDDQTILHNAIIRENFDLAFQIIHLYKVLVNFADKEDATPLHALAKKPAAFKSGSNLRGRDKIVYNCTSVRELKFEPSKISDPNHEGVKDKTNPGCSKNNPTCLNYIGLLLRNPIRAGHAKNECANVDIENHGRTDRTDSNPAQVCQYFMLATHVEYFVKVVRRAIPFILGYGHMSIKKIQKEKEKHVWAAQVLNELLGHATMYDGKVCFRASQQPIKTEKKFSEIDSSDDESREDHSDDDDHDFGDDISESSKNSEKPSSINNLSEAGKELESVRKKETTKDTAILLAAKFGIAEMVEKILNRFSVAIYDKDKDSKNVVLVAVENRHLEVYKLLINRYERKDFIFQKVDKKGNTALHYAAMYDQDHTKPWPVPGAALQMQWEIKWHEFVEDTMPPRLYLRTNMEGKTPREMFSDTHKCLVKAGGKWLTSTATSCSVVATLIATVAFASSTNVPGGGSTTDTKNGKTTFKRANPITFELFAILSLIALCFSVTSLIMFLAILTSRHQEKDFGKELPRKILLGLTSLFVSIASMLVTFCAGHFLVFENNIKYAAFPVYAVTLLPLCLFGAAQFPLYFDLLLATFWSPF